MPKQPFYHYVDGVIFTCTEPLTKEEFLTALEKGLKGFGFVKGTAEIYGSDGYKEPEAGDPDDL